MSDYSQYIDEVLNLLEVNNFLPPKLLDRAKNRVKINQVRRLIEQENKIEIKEQLQNKLKDYLDREIRYQKIFSKFNKEKFLEKVIRKLCG